MDSRYHKWLKSSGEKVAWVIQIPKSTVVGTENVDTAMDGDKVYVQVTKVDEGPSVRHPGQSFVLTYSGFIENDPTTRVLNTRDTVKFHHDVPDSIVPHGAEVTFDFRKLVPQDG